MRCGSRRCGLATKEGDDFAVRLYVTFDLDTALLSAADRMVVVHSGAAKLGTWVSHQRDVAADFRRAFALEPPAVNAVIVASDTDNTGETAEAY